MRNRQTMRIPAATVLAVIGAAVVGGLFAGCAYDIATTFTAPGVSSHNWWAAEVVLAQAAATWILATICQRATSTTASSRRRRRHCDLSCDQRTDHKIGVPPRSGVCDRSMG